MSQLAGRLAVELACSELAAREFVKFTEAIAKALVELRRRYDIDLVIDTKRQVALQNQFGRSQTAKAVSKAIGQLPSSANRLWSAFRTAGDASEKLRSALFSFDHTIPGDGEALTYLLSFLHEQRALTQPDQVVEGRAVYEALQRDYSLLSDLGLR